MEPGKEAFAPMTHLAKVVAIVALATVAHVALRP